MNFSLLGSVKLVAAQVIHQHMYFFTLSYFLDNNLGGKKVMIALVHENHDNGQILHQFNILAVVLTTQIWEVLSMVPKISQIVYFFRI